VCDETYDDTSVSTSSSNSSNEQANEQNKKKDRSHFDYNMYDTLERILILKVFSHQLNRDFTKKYEYTAKPESVFGFCYTDNAATQAREIIKTLPREFESMLSPPFSPRWTFTFNGCTTNKGATNVSQEKIDEELGLQLQHHPKHGLFYRLRKFVGLTADQIGNESLLRNIIKLTAPCWTRSIYRYPPLANLIWQSWQATLPADIHVTKPINIPKDWQKHSDIADEIIKACPFCNQGDNNTRKSIGNLEHLNIFCTSQILVGARSFCHQKIENAIFALYDFASMREYGTPLQETLQISSLQERMERVASELELLERPIVQNSYLILRSRDTNKCILSRHSLNTAILLNKIPAERLYGYDKYPLAHRVGFIHLINENDFDIAAATIVDVGFLGLFPKAILHIS